jgi:A1 cistron-splicing factor AAR2
MKCSEAVEGGLFEFKEEDSSGWLRSLLGGFKEKIKDVHDEEGPLWKEIEELEEYMEETYGWEFSGNVLKRGLLELEDGERVEMDMNEADEEDETGEYAPVIVDLGDTRDPSV